MDEKIKINLDQLKDAKLEQDIFNYEGQLLLRKGSPLSNEIIIALKKRGIEEVYVLGEAVYKAVKEDLCAIKPGSTSTRVEEVYNKALDYVKSFMSDLKMTNQIDITEVTNTVKNLSNSYLTDADLLGQLRRIRDKDEYTFTHSVNVSIISTMIGRWLDFDTDTVTNLGIAGMLHDIGKVYIPEDILNKPGKLSSKEYEIMKNHSVIGYRLCHENKHLDPAIEYAVLMHHERMDGSGYPAELGRDRITSFAAIIAIADTYDAVTSKRVYSEKRSPYIAADIILRESLAGKIDQRISKIFYDQLLALSVGNQVLLSNDQKGVVIYINPLKPSFPTVKVGETIYNLDKDKSVFIKEVL